MEPREIRLRYDGTCKECGTRLAPGDTAWHFRDEKKVACVTCFAAAADTRDVVVVLPQARPGESARREYKRRDSKRRDQLQERWGSKLGKMVWLLEEEKQSTASWQKGAKGEREAGEYLEKKLADTHCEILHDRAIPGSRANIDHIVVGPAGVTVTDTKNIKGKVRSTTNGIGKRKQRFLMVDGRDRTKLIAGVNGQIDVVRSILCDLQPPIDVPVRGVICWWHYDGLPMIGTNDIEIDGVQVLNPRSSARAAGAAGELSEAVVSVVADYLDARLRPA